MMVLEPSCEMLFSTLAFSPLITAPITIMVVTPIMMPSTVSTERMGLRRNTSSASRIASFSSPNFPSLRTIGSSWFASVRSFLPQRHHGVKPRGFRRRVDSEEQADAGGDDQPHQHRPNLHRAGQWSRQTHNFRHQDPENYAANSADGRDRGGLNQELRANVHLPRAQRFSQPDFAGPLGHAHQHDVHDHDAPHN